MFVVVNCKAETGKYHMSVTKNGVILKRSYRRQLHCDCTTLYALHYTWKIRTGFLIGFVDFICKPIVIHDRKHKKIYTNSYLSATL